MFRGERKWLVSETRVFLDGTRLELRRKKEEIVALREEMWAAAGGAAPGGTGMGRGEWLIPCPLAEAGTTGRGVRRVRIRRRRGISGVGSRGLAAGGGAGGWVVGATPEGRLIRADQGRCQAAGRAT